MQVVVVESPAKARTVGAYLGRGYRVLACYGLVSDLPAKPGSVRPDDGFAMVYETAGRRAARALGIIRAALLEAEGLVLATDPDREGEAIAWQVLSWLRERDALGDRPVRRVAFHEITREAVREAMARPRGIDMDLVRAQQARRALDYLVGFGLSPVLWRKVPGCRSAGRVQSVALRLVCEREAEIEAFAPRAYWTVEAQAAGSGAALPARPVRLDEVPLDGSRFETRAGAEAAARRIREAAFTVASVARSTVRRRPNPAFTTATLQQEASRRLGFGIKRTMALAQALYEGIDLGGERAGLVTYMRTDSVALSKAALGAARRVVLEHFGEAYLPRNPRVHRSGARHVQEAHEAIRPTDFARTPESLEGRLEGDEARLYALIRDRALASQMVAQRRAPALLGPAAALPVPGVDRDDRLARFGEGRCGARGTPTRVAALGDGAGVVQRPLAGHRQGDHRVAAEADAGGPAVEAHALRPRLGEAAARGGLDEQAQAEAAAPVAVAAGEIDVSDEGGGQHSGRFFMMCYSFGYESCTRRSVPPRHGKNQ